MSVFSVLGEIWRDILSGVSRAASFAVCVFSVVACCAGVDAMQIIVLERQVNDFRAAKGDVSLVKLDHGVNGQACADLSQSQQIQASGALRQAEDTVLKVLPSNAITTYEVTDGMLNVVDDTQSDHIGVWVPTALASKLGVARGSVLDTRHGELRIAGVYNWNEDGRDTRLGYAVLIPVAATGVFDECWASSWPSAEISAQMRQSVYAARNPTQAQVGSLNYTVGSSLDAYGLFSTRLTRFGMPFAGVVVFVLSFMYCRRRRLEFAGDMHVGVSKSTLVVQMIGEYMLPGLTGLICAYGGLFLLLIIVCSGFQGISIRDAYAIFECELLGSLWVIALLDLGVLVSVCFVRERDLFKLFKAR